MMDARRSVGASEIAVVVLQYLNDSEFTRTVKSFKREAKEILPSIKQVPRGVKPLADILSEYVALKEANTRRLQLLASNPALGDIFQVIEAHAAASQQGSEAAPQQYIGTPTAAAGGQRKRRRSTAAEAGQQEVSAGAAEAQQETLYFDAEDAGAAGFGGEFEEGQPGSNAVGISPRKTLRKRAPRKRKKAAAAGEAVSQQDQAGDGYGASMMDLLNLPINERALESLLAGEWQGRFAEGLACCINGRLGPQQQLELEQLDAQDAAAGLPVYDESEMNTWMESLTGDPGMAALLEPIVAPSSQEAQGHDFPGDGHEAMPYDMQLVGIQDDIPVEQPAASAASPPEPEEAPQGNQQEPACASQAAEAAWELPAQPPVQATPSAPAAAQKARRRLSLEPTAFPPAGAPQPAAPEQPAGRQLQEVLPQAQKQQETNREASGATIAEQESIPVSPMRDELFAAPPESLPAVLRSGGTNEHREGQKSPSAKATATPKLSAFLADPMSTLDGFPAHILAEKTSSGVRPGAPTAAAGAQPARKDTTARQGTDAPPERGADAEGAAGAALLASRERSTGLFKDPVSTLDGFSGAILAAKAAQTAPRQQQAAVADGPSPDSAQQGKGRSAGVIAVAVQFEARERSTGLFSDPIGTLDGIPDILRKAAAGGASPFEASAQADVVLPAPTFSNLSFLDAMPTLDGFPQLRGSPEDASGQAPGSGASATHALSPIPLRLAPDGRLSDGPGATHRDDSSAGDGGGAFSALWRENSATVAVARQGPEASARSFQERGIWRTEESMDAVLNQDAFEESPSLPVPANSTHAVQVAPAGQPASAAASTAAKEAAPTDFRGLQARLSGGGIALGPSTCGQQQGGGKAGGISGSVFAGGASAETLDAFMRSLKY